MSKKAHKRQSTIITLSDQNQQEIRNIQQQKEDMLADFEKKKQGTVFLQCVQYSMIRNVHGIIENAILASSCHFPPRIISHPNISLQNLQMCLLKGSLTIAW